MDESDQLDNIRLAIRDHLQYLMEDGVSGIHSSKMENQDPGMPSNEFTSSQDQRSYHLKLMNEIRDRIGECTRCRLHQTRSKIVFGEGNATPDIVFIGEGPGRDEDILGRPFVGKAGQLLDRIINAMGVSRKDVYITNMVKCRPPNNRVPESDEILTCNQFLVQQIDVLRPKIICALGNCAAQFLLQSKVPMTVIHGKFFDYRGICVCPTYHPAALLRNPEYRRPVWEDVQKIMQYLGQPIPIPT